MALFAIGNLLLKTRSARLPVSERATPLAVGVALAAIALGVAGNITPENLELFAIYFGVMALVVGVMFVRLFILQGLFYISHSIVSRVQHWNESISKNVIAMVEEINSRSVIYFTRGDGIVALNHAALYVLENEQTQRLIVVHVYEEEADIPPDLAQQLKMVDHLYPELRIDFVAVQGRFGPDIIG